MTGRNIARFQKEFTGLNSDRPSSPMNEWRNKRLISDLVNVKIDYWFRFQKCWNILERATVILPVTYFPDIRDTLHFIPDIYDTKFHSRYPWDTKFHSRNPWRTKFHSRYPWHTRFPCRFELLRQQLMWFSLVRGVKLQHSFSDHSLHWGKHNVCRNNRRPSTLYVVFESLFIH